MTDTDTKPLHAAVLELIGHGPLPIGTLLAELDRRSLLDEFRTEGVAEEHLGDAVIYAILDHGGIWPTVDDVVASTGQLLDGAVFTHVLTPQERSDGTVMLTPDLVVLDYDLRGGLVLETGGPLTAVHGARPHVPGFDFTVYSGPEGWLDRFATGDLLAFRRTGSSVSLSRVDDDVSLYGEGGHEVDLLRAAVEARIPVGQAEESPALILDALTADPSAFRRPLRPIGELLVRAGLTQRGFLFRRVGEPWEPIVDDVRARRIAVHRWNLDECCELALDTVQASFLARYTSEHPGESDRKAAPALDIDAVATDAVATALGHGMVAPAFVEIAQDRYDDAQLRDFAATLEQTVRGTRRCPVLFLAAQFGTEVLLAESRLRDALAINPDYGPASDQLADFEIDRGNLARAATLLRQSPFDATLRIRHLDAVREHLERPYRYLGRNDPCVCGSGRKFKQCCQRSPVVSLDDRMTLLTFKLTNFAKQSCSTTVVGIATSACDFDDPELVTNIRTMADRPAIIDFAVWEGGIADHYVDERGPLLPHDEAELIEDMLLLRRRLYEVTSVRPDELSLVDVETGEPLTIGMPSTPRMWTPGELLIARLAQRGAERRVCGVGVAIPDDLRQSALDLLSTHPDAGALAAWYGGLTFLDEQ